MSQVQVQTTTVTTPAGRPFIVLQTGGLKDLCASYLLVLQFFENAKRLLMDAKTRKGSLIEPAGAEAKPDSLALNRQVDYCIARMALQLAVAELDAAVETLNGEVAIIGGIDVRGQGKWLCPSNSEWGVLIAYHDRKMAQELLSLVYQWRKTDCKQADEFFEHIELPREWA